LSFEGFTLDPTARTLVNAGGEEISLRRSEFELLLAFVNRPGRALTRDYLLEMVAGRQSEAFDRSIDVLVGRLRRKLERDPKQPRLILTVPGIGYRFAGKPYPVSLPPEEKQEATPEALPLLPVASSEGASAESHAICPGELDGAVATVRNPASAQIANLQPVGKHHRRHRSRVAIGATGAAAALIITIGAWWLWAAPKSDPTPVLATATSVAQPLIAPRLSIVVLPFNNVNNDPEQQYFADGITEDLTTDLSRIPRVFVISRNSAFSYRNKSADTRQIGRELGVRFALEGSVQRSGTQLRVNAQLIDAETGAHLWAERFEHELNDLFALQNEITSRIAIALNLELIGAEAARPAERPDAMDYIFRGRAVLLKPVTPDGITEAIGLFEHALVLDPRSVDAQSLLANMLIARAIDVRALPPGTDDPEIRRAEELAMRAVSASPRSSVAHFAKAQVLRFQRRCEAAIPEYETVLALNRNSVGALAFLSRCKTNLGQIDEAIPLVKQAIRLSPRDPGIANWYWRIGEAQLLESHIDEAIVWLEKARGANPSIRYVHGYLAAAYALKGETEHAATELAEARRSAGGVVYSSIARLKDKVPYEHPRIRAQFKSVVVAGWRKAGVPEE
jgi:TolB-like protein/DNA-binding winged helix-turn-helix (wHTH) protein